MAKKGTTKPAEKLVEKVETKKVDEKATEKVSKSAEKLVEKVPFKAVNEINMSKPKTLNFEEGVKDAKMLLKCFGDEKIQLGKGTDGNVIFCKGETHAVLQFSEIWQLMSICKL